MAIPVDEPARAITGQLPGGDDAAIIAESLADPERFAVLYDRYADQLHRYAGRRLGGADAEDMVATTFLAAFRARGRFDTTRPD
jgi:RNA polymerase sigma-70 factor, ECF subfamily